MWMRGRCSLRALGAFAHTDPCTEHLLHSSTVFLAVCLSAARFTPVCCGEIAALAPPLTPLTASQGASPCGAASGPGSPSGKPLLTSHPGHRCGYLQHFCPLPASCNASGHSNAAAAMFRHERMREAPKRQHECCFSPPRDPATAIKRQSGGRREGAG